LTTKFTQLTRRLRHRLSAISFQPSVSLPTVPSRFHDAFVSAHRSWQLLRTAEPQQKSKALIKHYLFNSRLVVFFYPMLFSCQKSSRPAASHTRWKGNHQLPVLNCQKHSLTIDN
jgi:hypothetical protein